MNRKFPKTVVLDADEVHRANRVRLARYYGKFPHEVDAMPESDFDDTMQVLWADAQK